MRASIATLLALAALGPADASACSCIQVSPTRSLEEHDAVFEGRVVEIERPDDPATGRVRVTMAVVQHWKGIESERVVVTTAGMESMCGVSFAPDTSWLVYADLEGDGFTTGLCSRTRRIEEAEEDLAELGAGVVPVDITEDDEVEAPLEDEPPARGGCASCTVGAPGVTRLGPIAALLVLVIGARRRR